MRKRLRLILLVLLALAACRGETPTREVIVLQTGGPTGTSTVATPSITPTSRLHGTFEANQTQNAFYATPQAAVRGVSTLTPSGPTFTPTITFTPSLTPTPTTSYFVQEGTPFLIPPNPITANNADQITELARWGMGAVQQIEFSPDGSLMFVLTSTRITAYRTGTLSPVWEAFRPESCNTMAVSPAGDVVAVGTYSGEIITFGLNTGTMLDLWTAHTGTIEALAISHSGEQIASGMKFGGIIIWEVRNGFQLALDRFIDEVDFLSSLVYIAPNQLMVYAENRYRILNPDEGTWSGEPFKAVSFSPDWSLYGTNKDEIRYLHNHQLILSVDVDDSFSMISKFSIDNKLVAVTDVYGRVQVWNIETGEILYTLNAGDQGQRLSFYQRNDLLVSGPGPDAIRSLAFSPDNQFLATSNGYGNIIMWDLSTQSIMWAYLGDRVNIRFSQSGDSLIAHRLDEILILNIKTGYVLDRINEGWFFPGKLINQVTNILISPDGNWIAHGTRLWDMSNQSNQRLSTNEAFVTFSADSQRIYSITPGWWVRVRRVHDLALIRQIQLATPETNGWGTFGYGPLNWKLSPNERFFYSTYFEGPMVIWDIQTGVIAEIIEAAITSVSISSSGQYVAAYPMPGGVGVFRVEEDSQSHNLLFTLSTNHFANFDFSIDEEILIILEEEALKTYSLSTGQLINQWNLPEEDFSDIAYSQIGSIAALTRINDIWLFDIQTGEVIQTLSANPYPFRSIYPGNWLAFSPDGRFLTTAGWDGTVRLWGVP